MNELHLDVETYCELDLKAAGAYRYCAHPSFRVLMVGWAVDDEPVRMETDPEAYELIPGLTDPAVRKVAHNAAFERLVFSRVLGLPLGEYLPPEEWFDTMALAAEFGWPQSLDMLSEAIGGERKDSAGTRLINLFSKPNRAGERVLPEDRPEQWQEFLEYCRQDVVTSRSVYRALGEEFPTKREERLFHVDQHINDRGMDIDLPMVKKAQEAAEDNQIRNELLIWRATGGAIRNPSSVQQMIAWFREQGVSEQQLPNLTAAAVRDALRDEELTPVQRQVLEHRQELALSAAKKYPAALDMVMADRRIRGMYRFFGAHTGRWAGRGVQPHNLPREQFENGVYEQDAIDHLMEHGEADSLTLKKLVRSMFIGPMTVVDYSAIEARIIAWLAGEEWALEAFEDGRDIYVETAERMGGLTRFQGKVAVLALGYAGGVNSLRAMAGDPVALKRIALPPGVDVFEGEHWSDIVARINEPHLTQEQGLQDRVDQWRKTNRRIVRLWGDLEEAFDTLGTVGDHLSVTESTDALGRAVHIHLPSGRAITYHGVRYERYVVNDPVTGRPVRKKGWRYANPRNPMNKRMRIGTYGGRLAENVTQATARDVLGEGLMRLWERGYDVIGHVHDEVMVAGEHEPELISKIITETPDWAPGLPLDADGFVTNRYRKG